MWTHQPAGYDCPFCRIQIGDFDEHNQPGDVVAVTDLAYARISPKWWPRNPGAVLVITREHRENLYSMPAQAGNAVWDLTQRVAVAMRTAYTCDGISTRQHNEPAGGQDVWHFHVHLFARHRNDRLYESNAQARWVSSRDRAEYAERLAAELDAERTFD